MAFKLGLTGSFGSGKTTVSAMFRERGVAVIDADQLARVVVEPGQPALAQIVQAFGPDLLDDQGRLRRKALAARVFSDRPALQRLNQIVHPYVRALELSQLEAFKASPLVVLDVPLLFEGGLNACVDKVAVVTISENQRFARLRRRGFTESEIIARLAMQMPQVRKISMADMIIDNSGTIESTRNQVQNLLDEIQREKSKER